MSTNNDVLMLAVDKWGIDSQLNMLVEECSELITATMHLQRRSNLVDVIHDFHEELADVEIMLEQMRLIFDSDMIDKVKKRKMDRLAKRVKIGGYHG